MCVHLLYVQGVLSYWTYWLIGNAVQITKKYVNVLNLRVRYNLGGGAQVLTVGSNLADGAWHKVVTFFLFSFISSFLVYTISFWKAKISKLSGAVVQFSTPRGLGDSFEVWNPLEIKFQGDLDFGGLWTVTRGSRLW